MQREKVSEENRRDVHVPLPAAVHAAHRLKTIRVVVLVLTLLVALAILLPVLDHVRQQAFRAVCATHLSGIGMAMLGYAHDYDGEFPRSGGPDSRWGRRIPNWIAQDRRSAYGLTAEGARGVGTISSSFYLLIKYGFSLPLSDFVCRGDAGTGVFDPAKEGVGDRRLHDLWDFGAVPSERVSYSYHMPFGVHRLKPSSNPGMVIAADRNPFIESPMAEPKSIGLFVPEGDGGAIKIGNAYQHQGDGQNVLFVDTHVRFEKAPYCGVDDDNIYTFWDGGDIRRGAMPLLGSEPQDQADSLLVHD